MKIRIFPDTWKWYTIQMSVAVKLYRNTAIPYMIFPGYFFNFSDCSAGLHSPYSSHSGPWLISKHLSHLPALTMAITPWWTLPPLLPSGVCTNETESEKSFPPITLFLLSLLNFLQGTSTLSCYKFVYCLPPTITLGI